jgi:hypothetical protein
MNEMELLTRLRDEIPAGPASSGAEAALLAAIAADHPPVGPGPAAVGPTPGRGPLTWRAGTRNPGRRPGWRPAVAGGMAVALIAGTSAVAVFRPGTSRPARGLTVAELAYRTSAAAAAGGGAAVRPGQWVYRQVDTAGAGFILPGRHQVWLNAAGTRTVYGSARHHFSLPWGAPTGYGLLGAEYATPRGKPVLPYASLSSLPRDPRALERYLAHLPDRLYGTTGQFGPPREMAFTFIMYLLTDYVTSPRLTSELYRALGYVPGIAVDGHLSDIAGRPGVGYVVPDPNLPGDQTEVVFNPRTYQFRSYQFAEKRPGRDARILAGTTVLRQAVVAGPGVLP